MLYPYIYIYIGCGPLTATVTTRIITFLLGDPYKPSFTTVTVRGPHPTYTYIHTYIYILYIYIEICTNFQLPWLLAIHHHPTPFASPNSPPPAEYCQAMPFFGTRIKKHFVTLLAVHWLSTSSSEAYSKFLEDIFQHVKIGCFFQFDLFPRPTRIRRSSLPSASRRTWRSGRNMRPLLKACRNKQERNWDWRDLY